MSQTFHMMVCWFILLKKKKSSIYHYPIITLTDTFIFWFLHFFSFPPIQNTLHKRWHFSLFHTVSLGLEQDRHSTWRDQWMGSYLCAYVHGCIEMSGNSSYRCQDKDRKSRLTFLLKRTLYVLVKTLSVGNSFQTTIKKHA